MLRSELTFLCFFCVFISSMNIEALNRTNIRFILILNINNVKIEQTYVCFLTGSLKILLLQIRNLEIFCLLRVKMVPLAICHLCCIESTIVLRTFFALL